MELGRRRSLSPRLEEAIEILDFSAGLQRDEEELPLPVVGVSQLDRLLSRGELRNLVTSVIRDDHGVGLGQGCPGVTCELE